MAVQVETIKGGEDADDRGSRWRFGQEEREV